MCSILTSYYNPGEGELSLIFSALRPRNPGSSDYMTHPRAHKEKTGFGR
jgi:hypothetical protein